MGDVIGVEIIGAPVPAKWETDLRHELAPLSQTYLITLFIKKKLAWKRMRDLDKLEQSFRLKRELEIIDAHITDRQSLIDELYSAEQERRLREWRGL